MGLSSRILLIALTICIAACGGAGSGSGRNGSTAEDPARIEGVYASGSRFEAHLRILTPGAPSATAIDRDCLGTLAIVIDRTAPDAVVGRGRCTTQDLFATYELVGELIDEHEFQGELTLRYAGVDHVMRFDGRREGKKLEATFSARRSQSAEVEIEWMGRLRAERA